MGFLVLSRGDPDRGAAVWDVCHNSIYVIRPFSLILPSYPARLYGLTSLQVRSLFLSLSSSSIDERWASDLSVLRDVPEGCTNDKAARGTHLVRRHDSVNFPTLNKSMKGVGYCALCTK